MTKDGSHEIIRLFNSNGVCEKKKTLTAVRAPEKVTLRKLQILDLSFIDSRFKPNSQI